jgi:HAD superfamily hydrolase (TIGR01662 family)
VADINKLLRADDSHISTVLFDLGSTLIYFEGDWEAVILEGNLRLVRFLKESGFQIDEDNFLKRFRAELQAYFIERETEFIEHTSAYILRQVFLEYGYPAVPDKVIRDALRVMYSVSQAYWKPESDTHPTLDLLITQGYSLGLISNASDDDDVQSLIDQARLRPYFGTILTSAAQGIRKPNPQIFFTALTNLAAQPGQAVMVGDTLGADILGARNAGMRSIWITRRADSPANRAHADTIQPDATIATLSELPRTLAHLNGA